MKKSIPTYKEITQPIKESRNLMGFRILGVRARIPDEGAWHWLESFFWDLDPALPVVHNAPHSQCLLWPSLHYTSGLPFQYMGGKLWTDFYAKRSGYRLLWIKCRNIHSKILVFKLMSIKTAPNSWYQLCQLQIWWILSQKREDKQTAGFDNWVPNEPCYCTAFTCSKTTEVNG